MVRPHDLVIILRDVEKDDVRLVGSNASKLGEMLEAGFPIIPSFVVTNYAYLQFLKQNQLDKKIEGLLSTINYANSESLMQVSAHIKRAITQSEIPVDITKEIFKLYSRIGSDSYVSISPSATPDDESIVNDNGHVNVKGEANLCERIRLIWASLFDPAAIHYRHQRNRNHLSASIGVLVEKMVDPESSGVMLTANPTNSSKDKIIMDAVFGLSGKPINNSTPDHYEVAKKTFHITNLSVGEQVSMLRNDHAGIKTENVPTNKRKQQKIKDFEIIALARLAEKIEKFFYFPQMIEWVKEENNIYITNVTPLTHFEEKIIESIKPSTNGSNGAILIGNPLGQGIVVGKVKKITDHGEFSKVKKGDILVVKSLDQTNLPFISNASGVISETETHSSIGVALKNVGIPVLVNTLRAFEILKNDEIITINSRSGEVFRGGFLSGKKSGEEEMTFKTATKLMISLEDPSLAGYASSKNVDGVGLLKSEFMISKIGMHPKKIIHEGKSKYFVDSLAEEVGQVCKAFYPRPVYYRVSDFKSTDLANLGGGKLLEPKEENPVIGYRGGFRYIHDKKVFGLELDAIKKVREKMKLNNLNLMLPFVRTINELIEVKKVIALSGLKRSHTFKLNMIAEVPSNVILIDEFIKVGIDGVSIDSDDLAMLILGVDKDNPEISLEFDQRNPAVIWAFEKVIKACKKEKVDVSVVGLAPSIYPSLIDDLISFGVDSISVSPDFVDTARRLIYSAEGGIVRRAK